MNCYNITGWAPGGDGGGVQCSVLALDIVKAIETALRKWPVDSSVTSAALVASNLVVAADAA